MDVGMSKVITGKVTALLNSTELKHGSKISQIQI